MKKMDNFIVFYKSIKKGFWPDLLKKKMPNGWEDGGWEYIYIDIFNKKYDTEAYFIGGKSNQQKMRKYLKELYNLYKKEGYISDFTIRKKYPKKKK